MTATTPSTRRQDTITTKAFTTWLTVVYATLHSFRSLIVLYDREVARLLSDRKEGDDLHKALQDHVHLDPDAILEEQIRISCAPPLAKASVAVPGVAQVVKRLLLCLLLLLLLLPLQSEWQSCA